MKDEQMDETWMDDLLVEISGVDGCFRIQAAITIPEHIDEVWNLATQSATVGWWFSPGKIEAEGGRIQLNYIDGSFGMAGDVKVLFPPHVFEFTWDAHELSEQTIIRFDFVATGDRATRATVTSFVFDGLDTTYLVIATWRFMLERLQRAVTSETEIPDDESRVAQLVREIRQQHERQELG